MPCDGPSRNFDDFGARRARQGTKKPRRRTIWQGLTLRISVDMMYDPRLQIYCNPPSRLLSQALASHGGRTRHILTSKRSGSFNVNGPLPFPESPCICSTAALAAAVPPL
nr:MAG TPA: hypothetical protein [Caudoviricetes sp.]